MTCNTRFSPAAKGWVVRITSTSKDHTHVSWWHGPHSGWGTTSGPLDYSVAVFPTKKEALAQARQYDRRGATVERVADAVAFAITECDHRKESVLAGDRPDRQEIAAANDRTKAYLQGVKENAPVSRFTEEEKRILRGQNAVLTNALLSPKERKK